MVLAGAGDARVRMLRRMPNLTQGLRSALRRLEHEAAVWRQEPIKRVKVRNDLLRPLRTRQFHTFGELAIVDRPMWLYGPQQISIGARVIILRNGWLAVERGAWGRPAPVLDIPEAVPLPAASPTSPAPATPLPTHSP